MADKDRERKVLRMVYGDDFTVVPREVEEQPDFVLSGGANIATFGVEVTDLFESEALARVRMIPTYISELVAGERPRHKDDAQALPVNRVEITDSEGNHKQFCDAIIVEEVNDTEYRRLLVETIRRKCEKLRKYDSSVTHTNLVILDTTGHCRGVDKNNIGWYFLSDGVPAELVATQYREIVVVTDLGSQGWFCVPLKAHYLISTARFFDLAIDSLGQGVTDTEIWLNRFATFLCERGNQVYRLHPVVAGPAVLIGNSGVGFQAEDFIVFDMAEMRTPAEAERVECDRQTQSTKIHEKFEELIQTHNFIFGAIPAALLPPPE